MREEGEGVSLPVAQYLLGFCEVDCVALLVKSAGVEPGAVSAFVAATDQYIVQGLVLQTHALSLHKAVDYWKNVLVGRGLDQAFAQKTIPEEFILAALGFGKEARGGTQTGDLLHGQGEVVVVGKVKGVREDQGF